MEWPTNEHPIVEVLWEDSISTYGWHDEDDSPVGPSLIVSVGYAKRDDTTGVLLVESLSYGDKPSERQIRAGTAIFIPRSAVRAARTLTVGT